MDKFCAIAEPNRRKILEMLAKRGSMSASEIGKHFPSSAPAISQHLKILRNANAVSVLRKGQQRIYRLNPEAINSMATWASSLASMAKQWQQRLENLDMFLLTEQNKIINSYHSQLIKRRNYGVKKRSNI